MVRQLFEFVRAKGCYGWDESWSTDYDRCVEIFGVDTVETSLAYIHGRVVDAGGSFDSTKMMEEYELFKMIFSSEPSTSDADFVEVPMEKLTDVAEFQVDFGGMMGAFDPNPPTELESELDTTTVKCSQCKKSDVTFATFKNGVYRKTCVGCTKKRARRQTKKNEGGCCIQCKKTDGPFSVFKKGDRRKLTCDGCCEKNRTKRTGKPLVSELV